jgi:hypothetical protein
MTAARALGPRLILLTAARTCTRTLRMALALLLSGAGLCSHCGASLPVLLQIVAVIELLTAPVTFQLVLILHVESPFIKAVEVAALAQTNQAIAMPHPANV